MELGILDEKHDSYDAPHWAELDAICKGGKVFKNLLTKFLPSNPVEPPDIYAQRKAQAHFMSYTGSIINLYTSWLFVSGFSAKPYKSGSDTPVEEVPAFYGQFQEDVGHEQTLTSFIKERVRTALTTHKAHWLIELPSNEGLLPSDRAEYDERGLGKASLKAIEREELLDWEENDEGEFEWAILHTCFQTRPSWAAKRDMFIETWRVYDREFVYTFQLQYKEGQRPIKPETQVPQIGEPVPHGFKRVPIVKIEIPKELCIGEQTYDPQLEHFRQDNALSWLIRRTCYAQPVFNIEDGERPPTMGAGYAIVIGKDDKMGWTSPPVAPFDVLQKNIDSKRDEIYRVVHQMAQGLDNNAETVGRSADSKEIDAAATRLLLNEYGSYVCAAIEETYEIISEAREEEGYEWSVEGFAGYDTTTVNSLIANAKEAKHLGIPSQAFHQELMTKVALALIPETDQRVKDTVRREISGATFNVNSESLEQAKTADIESKAKLNDAKADAEPVKAGAAQLTAQASMKSANRPAPKPSKPTASSK